MSRSHARSFSGPVLLLLLLPGIVASAPTAAEAVGPAAAPLALRVEAHGTASRLWVESAGSDGVPQRTLLRETAARIEPGRAGRDPAGRAAFATWTEGFGEPWSAFSLDGGATWSRARPSKTELLFRDGAARPGAPAPAPRAGLALPPAGRVFVVQFRTVSLPAWRRALEDLGAEVLSFFAHSGHVIRVQPERLGEIAALEFVRRVEPFHPSYRVQEELREWLAQPEAAPERRRVLVQAFEWGEAGKRRIADTALGLGLEIAAWWPSGHVIALWVDREGLRRIAAHDDVARIERWTDGGTDMDLVRDDSGADWVESGFGACGQGVRGEVLDNGLEETHPDFDGVLLHGPVDQAAHGTSIYGVVFGNGARDGDGDAQATGMLPCAEQGIFADYQLFGDRFAHTQELKGAPYFASFQSNSWGHDRDVNYLIYSLELDDIIWRLDIAITQSQSNAGDQMSRPEAWAKNVISVGGVFHKNTLTTADDEWNGGASIGPAADGRIKPDVHYWYDEIYTTDTGSAYRPDFGGTSAATGHVSGVLGLILQMWADDVWGTSPVGTTVFEKQPHFSTLKALLINNAQQYDFTGTTDDLTRMHQGWGRPSARLARERAANSLIVDEELPLELAEPVAYDVVVPPGETELKVTLVYPDPPGVTTNSLHRVNDLDLTVTSPQGVVYHGNHGLDVGVESTPGGGPDTRNTVENVFVPAPASGTWKVEVEAVEVNQDAHLATPEDDAAFALVVTGAAGGVCAGPLADFTASPDPARVGQPITFDSTVSGGAGPPFAFAWDFDVDGRDDTTAEDPTHVYVRPYAGDVRLTARDAFGCPENVRHPLVVTGPDLRYDGFVDLVEVEGNGNGGVDPGEVWDVRVDLRNDGNEPAIGVSAELVVGPGNPGTLKVVQASSTFPDTPVGAVRTSDAPLRFSVGHDFPCGQDAVFSVRRIRSADPANEYPDEVGVLRVLVGGAGPPREILRDGFEFNAGWSAVGGGEWEFTAPLGLGGQSSIPGQIAKPDPASPVEGAQVLGTDLTGLGARPGNYENGIDTTITSPPIDASRSTDTELHFARWLNTESGDSTAVEVSADGASWTTVFSDPGDLTEQAWSQQTYDVSQVADGEGFFRVRFRLTSDFALVQGGWNIDDMRVTGVTPESCLPFSSPFPGEAISLSVDRGAGGDLELSWSADCGGAATYGVYRGDLAAGYGSLAPEPGQCSIAGTATTVPPSAGAADFFLVVPNDGASEGGYGPATGGPRVPASAACLPRGSLAACAQ